MCKPYIIKASNIEDYLQFHLLLSQECHTATNMLCIITVTNWYYGAPDRTWTCNLL